jgi:hypothetical protein
MTERNREISGWTVTVSFAYLLDAFSFISFFLLKITLSFEWADIRE